MNQHPTTNDTRLPVSSEPLSEKKDEIDTVNFDRRRRSEAIRQNEEYEREKRRRILAARRRAERIRRAKIARLKALLMFAVIALGCLCLVIAGIVAAVKALTSPKKTG